jgi:type IV secretion system protein TrbL
MGGVGVIDQFLNVFTTYIDSGFGLLKPEVGFLSAILIGIDLTLAGLFWALGGEEVVVRLVKKTLYVGFFAFLIGNFNRLAADIFNSFAQLGLTAAGSSVSAANFLQPGHLANVGIQAGWPILQSIGGLMGFTAFFANFVQIFVLLIAWVIVVATFFILAVQLFITLIEFKLTTLAGFVLVPFGLWGKSAFLAERVLGFVITCGVKVLVLAVIVGIGTTLFSQFTTALPSGGEQPSISDALTIILASAAMLGLGIFGPAIASGLVSGAPQLGAGAAIGTAGAIAGGALLAAGGAGAALGLGRAGMAGGMSALRAGASLGSGATTSYRLGLASSGQSGVAGVMAGLGGVARAGAGTATNAVRSAAARASEPFSASASVGRSAAWRATGGNSVGSSAAEGNSVPNSTGAPDWARRLRAEQNRRSQLHATTQAVKEGDRAGGAANPELDQRED